ncbi:hypothetical protein CLU79DRAFT_734421 [Phycomyces nitens]|nr:hypothetical protein CLU79DRAFT_734421 [Phycomyces nitens]
MYAESKKLLEDGDRCMVLHVGNERVHISKLEKCTKEPEANDEENPSNVKEISITDCDWNIEKLESKLWKMLKKNLSEKTGATPLKAAKNPNETIEVLPVNDLEELRKDASEQIQDTSDEDGAKGSTSPEERAEEQRSLSTLIDEFSFCGQNIGTNVQTFTLEECFANFIKKYQKGPKDITYDELREDVFKPVLTQLRESIKDQLTPKDEKVKAIIITGEVAKIPYFYEKLSQTIEDSCGIKPVSFKDMPIMNGAVKYNPSKYGFAQNVYRRTYGFLLRPFPDNNAVMEPTETNKFHVCVSRNDPIKDDIIKKKMYWKSDVLPIICKSYLILYQPTNWVFCRFVCV